MKTSKLLLALLVPVLLGACKPEKGVEAAPLDKIPSAVESAIREKYPLATGMVVSVLEEGKVYKSEFEVAGVPISVIANNSGILSTQKLAAENPADSIQAQLTGLAIVGGVSSNHRWVETPGQPARLVADYLLGGTSYTLSMEKTGYVQLSSSSLSYQTTALTDLPGAIQQFINERSKPNLTSLLSLNETLKQLLTGKNELAFESCLVYQLPTGAKQYRVYVKYFGLTTLPLVFGESGNLIWAANFNRLESLQNLNDLTGGLSKIPASELTQFKNLFSAATELTNFTLGEPVSNSNASLNKYGGVTGYEFNLSKPGNGGFGSESWHLAYDNNKAMVHGFYAGHAR